MRRAPLVIFVVWLVLCFGYNGWHIASFMANPAAGDLYERSWGFQIMCFCIFFLGFWVAALLFALGVEGYWHQRRKVAVPPSA